MRTMQSRVFMIAAAMVLMGGAVVWIGTKWQRQPESVAVNVSNDPQAVIDELKAGNLRYMASQRKRSTDTAHDAELRRQLTKGQRPIAALLCCSDSRLCPAFIFDQPPGALFEIRNAGNVVEDDALASMEYAVDHLRVRFLLVLGHTNCGAIEAVCAAGDQPLHDHLHDLQLRMPALRNRIADAGELTTSEWLNALAKENARDQAQTLVKESELIRQAVGHKEVCLMFALYDMESGRVDYFEVPWRRQEQQEAPQGDPE